MKSTLPALAAALLASCAPFAGEPSRSASSAIGEAPITRFAFGSCNGHEQPQHIWDAIAASNPQLFIAMGDNVYGDTGYDGSPGMETFIAAYATQAQSAPFAALRAEVPMLATWDDRDYGFNDSGGSFAHRELSEDLFEAFWNSPQDVRSRPGVYHSVTKGAPGQRVQFILLDTRFFRSDLVAMEEGGPLGRYTGNSDPSATVLGDAQWQWLQAELAKPADLRVLVSSIQVLSEAHNFEAWDNFPHERARLLDMLAARSESGLVVLSGDRHAAGLYESEWAGEEFIEFTASSLNRPVGVGTEAANAREPDPHRITPLVGEANFGTMEINWQAGEMTLAIRNENGAAVQEIVRAF